MAPAEALERSIGRRKTRPATFDQLRIRFRLRLVVTGNIDFASPIFVEFIRRKGAAFTHKFEATCVCQ
ncbi:MAG: hypothetical protein ACLQAT_27315, partial [Candidatus Binataceae bacterium]